jgi:hypothetical protein
MQQHHTSPVSDPTGWSTNRQLAARQRTAVQHEVTRLLDTLAPEQRPARHDPPSDAVRAYRWPARCILQGPAHAVSVSWFPGNPDDGSLGEMMVIVWEGVVSLPGSARRAPVEAVQVRTLTLHPVDCGVGDWQWQGPDGDPSLSTTALVDYCLEYLRQ